MSDESIEKFIKELDGVVEDLSIKIAGDIKSLHHQDYDGKRVHLHITDNQRYILATKLDIGVYKDFDIEQDEYCFNLDLIGASAKLLINSKEQIFTEKLKSLLRHGIRSTRYKDLFDFYYLITETGLDKDKLKKCIDILIFKDESMREKSTEGVVKRLNSVFKSELYRSHLTEPKVNWLDVSVDEAIDTVYRYAETLLK